MTDKQFRDTRRMLSKLCKKWQPKLGLNSWEITLKYDREPNNDAAATCKAKWQYKFATVTFFCHELVDYNVDELEEVVVHEFVHARVHEMREWGPEFQDKELVHQGHDHEERVVTELTRCFVDMDRDGRKNGKSNRN